MSGLTPEQKRQRLNKVTGTRIAQVALGDEHPYGGMRAAFVDAIGEGEDKPTGVMSMGTFLEPGIIAACAHKRGYAVGPGNTREHRTKPWAAATPDGYVVQEPGLVEAKFITFGTDQWGADDTPGPVPDMYRIQCAWQLAVVGADWCDLAACVNGALCVYRIERDLELEGYLMDIGERFYRDHIVPRKAPPPDGTPASAAWIKRRYPRDDNSIATATPEIAGVVASAITYRGVIAEATKRLEVAKQAVAEYMGNASAMTVPGLETVTYKAKKSNGTDYKGMIAPLLEMAGVAKKDRKLAEAWFMRPGSRQLLLKNNGGEDE